MKATRLFSTSLVLGTLGIFSGCLVPRARLDTVQTQNRILAEQCQAQLAEIENLEIHSHNTENQLIRTEEEVALMEEEVGMDRKQLTGYHRERAKLREQVKGLANGRAQMPPGVTKQLADLSDRFASLHFDPVTGISKLESDILFDSGQTELKPGAEQLLGEFVRVLEAPEAADLKIMVVGHTDNQRIAKKPAREKYPDNFHLSTARALVVADAMRQHGLSQQRIGVAGFGPHQPIAPNVSPHDRQKNRRVEIFVLNQNVPVVGWTDSIPSVY